MLLIAFLVVGPKDLPRVARWLGRMVRKMRLLIREVKKETGWDDLEKEYKNTKADINQTMNDIRKDVDISSDLKDASNEWNQSVKSVKDELHQTGQKLKEETKDIEKETIKK